MPRPPVSRSRIQGLRAAFTLPEVLIASTLSVLVMGGVLSAFLFFGRTGLAAGHYQEMETELRHSLELFSEDVRMATNINWTNAWQITLTVPDQNGTLRSVAYVFEPTKAGSSTGALHRVLEDGRRETLVNNVASDFAFKRYKLEQPGVADNTASNDLETKQLQLNLRTLRVTTGGPDSTQAAISARYILRNKRVSR
jgi:Tfp pilus assembly protein PilW